MDTEWKESQWFDEWLRLARREHITKIEEI